MKPPFPVIATVAALPITSLAVLVIGFFSTVNALAHNKPVNLKGLKTKAENTEISALVQLARLRGKLQLTAQQDTLWRIAERNEWNANSGQNERIRGIHAEVLELAGRPSPDLDKIVSIIRTADQEETLRNDERRMRWQELYEALNDHQKAQVNFLFENNIVTR